MKSALSIGQSYSDFVNKQLKSENRKFIFGGLVVLIILLAIFILPNLLKQVQDLRQRASNEKSQLQNTPKYSSTQILVKLKASENGKIKDNPTPEDTGVASINALNKKLKVSKIDKVAKPTNNSNRQADIFRWYKVTIPGPEKVISDDPTTAGVEPSDPSVEGAYDLGKDSSSPRGQLKNAMAAYKRLSEVETVEPDLVVEAVKLPNDTFISSTSVFSFGDLWGLTKMNMSQAWDVTTGSDSVVVADVDTGVDYNHPDLASNIFKDSNGNVIGYDFANNDSDPMDDNGHGTHTAGTIGAVGDNDADHATDSGTRTVGVNWKVKIMPIKFLNNQGSGYVHSAVSAWQFAADNGAKVINNSWGGSGKVDIISDAANYVASKGVVNIAAAGNNNLDASSFSPANEPKVITVSATNHNDGKACYSNFGNKIDVAAPGGDTTSCGGIDDRILSTRSSTNPLCTSTNSVGNFYCLMRGTSMAAPHVTGLAALILATHPDYTPEEIRSALRKTADKVGGSFWDNKVGFGRVNAANAVKISTTPGVAKIYSPYDGTISGSVSTVSVSGAANSRNGFQKYELQYGSGANPSSWTTVSTSTTPVNDGNLGSVAFTSQQNGAQVIRLLVTDAGGVYEDRVGVFIDRELMSGWPIPIYQNGFLNGIAIGDINGDGIKEIAYLDGCNVNVKKLDASNMPGFPQNFCTSSSNGQSITIEDINKDGKMEIIVNGRNILHAYTSNGSELPGWPVNLETLQPGLTNVSAYNIPAIGDITGDGNVDIVIALIAVNPTLPNSELVFAFGSDGKTLPGWPVKRADLNYSFFTGLMGVETQSLVDLDNDGVLDVIQTSMNDGNVFAWKGNGTPVNGWPKAFPGLSHASLSLTKRNSDGATLIAFTGDGGVNKFRCDGTNPCKLFLIDKNGNNVSGWPKNLSGCSLVSYCNIPSITLADVDGDSESDYIYRKTWGQVGAYKLNGSNTQLSLTSVTNGQFIGNGPGVSAAQVTGDNKLELGVPVIDNYPGIYVYSYPNSLIWSKDYSYLPGSIMTGGDIINMSDLDNDGKVEVVAVNGNISFLTIWVWKIGSSTHAAGTAVWEKPIADGVNSRNSNFNAPLVTISPINTVIPTSSTTPPTPTSTSTDTTTPIVNITAPLGGSTVTVRSNITIQANASDNIGVARVEFYIGGSLTCSDTTSPYSCSWKVPGAKNKNYSISAKAYDTAGNNSQATISVTAK